LGTDHRRHTQVQQPLTQGQAADARANAKKHRDTARELDEGLETQV
jgi:hypothetical protein